MPDKILKVVTDDPKTYSSVLNYSGPKGSPVVIGSGDGAGEWNYLCGSCFKIICATIGEYLPLRSGGSKNVIASCSSCGAYNEFPRTASQS